MSKNITALILIVLAVGMYFTFTKAKIAELNDIKSVNAQYKAAIDNAVVLFKERDRVLKDDIEISEEDNLRLERMLPDNVDNVRLIIDVKDNIAAKHGLFLKNLKTSSPDELKQDNVVTNNEAVGSTIPSDYGTVTLSFGVTTNYKTFLEFLKDLEASLRIMDVSSLSISIDENSGLYNFDIEVKTYWLK